MDELKDELTTRIYDLTMGITELPREEQIKRYIELYKELERIACEDR